MHLAQNNIRHCQHIAYYGQLDLQVRSIAQVASVVRLYAIYKSMCNTFDLKIQLLAKFCSPEVQEIRNRPALHST